MWEGRAAAFLAFSLETQCLGLDPRGTVFALVSKSFFSSTGGRSLLQGPCPFPPPQMNGPGHDYPFQIQQPPPQPPGPRGAGGKLIHRDCGYLRWYRVTFLALGVFSMSSHLSWAC